MDERKICADALDTWGPDAQTKMLFEEIGELMQAVCKVGRAMPSDKPAELPDLLAHVAEEIADVKIMLAQMEILFGVEDAVEDQKRHKLARLEGRIIKAQEGWG